MLRRHAPLIVAMILIMLVAAACVVRTRPVRHTRPVYVEGQDHKHKKAKPPKKHKKHKKHDH